MQHKQIMFLYNINLAFDEKVNPKLLFFWQMKKKNAKTLHFLLIKSQKYII